MNSRDYLDILHIAERLKDTSRHCTTSKRRVESVAEHSWRISLMASLLRSEFPSVDIDKVVSMCLIHDLGECFTGDIPALYNEMEAQETVESKLYKALDKLEALIQHNEAPLDTWDENEYELNKTYAFDTVAFSKWLTDLRNEILKDTLAKIDSEKPDVKVLLENLDKLHTTDMGVERIIKNTGLDNEDVVSWCREMIMNKKADIVRQGKNWYVRNGGCEITINAKSYTVITAHRIN